MTKDKKSRPLGNQATNVPFKENKGKFTVS